MEEDVLVSADVDGDRDRLSDGSGAEVSRALRLADPSIRCLLLTEAADEGALIEAVLAGALGVPVKTG